MPQFSVAQDVGHGGLCSPTTFHRRSSPLGAFFWGVSCAGSILEYNFQYTYVPQRMPKAASHYWLFDMRRRDVIGVLPATLKSTSVRA